MDGSRMRSEQIESYWESLQHTTPSDHGDDDEQVVNPTVFHVSPFEDLINIYAPTDLEVDYSATGLPSDSMVNQIRMNM